VEKHFRGVPVGKDHFREVEVSLRLKDLLGPLTRVKKKKVEVTQDKKMSRCHLPRVVYHQVYNVY